MMQKSSLTWLIISNPHSSILNYLSLGNFVGTQMPGEFLRFLVEEKGDEVILMLPMKDNWKRKWSEVKENYPKIDLFPLPYLMGLRRLGYIGYLNKILDYLKSQYQC